MEVLNMLASSPPKNIPSCLDILNVKSHSQVELMAPSRSDSEPCLCRNRSQPLDETDGEIKPLKEPSKIYSFEKAFFDQHQLHCLEMDRLLRRFENLKSGGQTDSQDKPVPSSRSYLQPCTCQNRSQPLEEKDEAKLLTEPRKVHSFVKTLADEDLCSDHGTGFERRKPVSSASERTLSAYIVRTIAGSSERNLSGSSENTLSENTIAGSREKALSGSSERTLSGSSEKTLTRSDERTLTATEMKQDDFTSLLERTENFLRKCKGDGIHPSRPLPSYFMSLEEQKSWAKGEYLKLRQYLRESMAEREILLNKQHKSYEKILKGTDYQVEAELPLTMASSSKLSTREQTLQTKRVKMSKKEWVRQYLEEYKFQTDRFVQIAMTVLEDLDRKEEGQESGTATSFAEEDDFRMKMWMTSRSVHHKIEALEKEIFDLMMNHWCPPRVIVPIELIED